MNTSLVGNMRTALIGKYLEDPMGRRPLLQSMMTPLQSMEEVVAIGIMMNRMAELEQVLVLSRLIRDCGIMGSHEMVDRAEALARTWRRHVDPIWEVMES